MYGLIRHGFIVVLSASSLVHLPSASTFHCSSFTTEDAAGRATEGEEQLDTTRHCLEMPAIILKQATPTTLLIPRNTASATCT